LLSVERLLKVEIGLLSNYPNAAANPKGAGRITVDAREKE